MRGMYVSYPTRIRAHGSRNPADIFLARRSLDYRDPSELRITCAATASAYVMTAITCTAFALRHAPQSKHIRLRATKDASAGCLPIYDGGDRCCFTGAKWLFRSNWYQDSTCCNTQTRCTLYNYIDAYLSTRNGCYNVFSIIYISRMRAKLCDTDEARDSWGILYKNLSLSICAFNI